MTKPKILVTSAAGNTGIPTTVQLLEKGFPVRALVRSDDHRAKRLILTGINQNPWAHFRRPIDMIFRVDR